MNIFKKKIYNSNFKTIQSTEFRWKWCYIVFMWCRFKGKASASFVYIILRPCMIYNSMFLHVRPGYISYTCMSRERVECQTRTDTAAMEVRKKNYGSFASRGIITKRTVRIANHPPIKGDISPWYHRKISISNNRSPHFHVQRERKLGGPDTHAGKKYIKIKRFLCSDEITLNHR